MMRGDWVIGRDLPGGNTGIFENELITLFNQGKDILSNFFNPEYFA